MTLAAAQLTFIVAVDRTDPIVGCQVTTLLLHFFLLSAFAWMVVEGYNLFATFVIIFQQKHEYTWAKYLTFGYGVPAMIATVTACVRWDLYAQDGVCWLPRQDGTLWAFVGPLIAALVVNVFIFIKVMRSIISVQRRGRRMSESSIANPSASATELKQALRATATFFSVLGLTWVLGIFLLLDLGDDGSVTLQYLFAILNGLQVRGRAHVAN